MSFSLDFSSPFVGDAQDCGPRVLEAPLLVLDIMMNQRCSDEMLLAMAALSS